MTGWLIVNEYLNTEKFMELRDLFMAAAKIKDIELIRLTNADFAISYDSMETAPEIGSFVCEGSEVIAEGMRVYSYAFRAGNPDFVIFYDKDIALARALEAARLNVFNSAEAIRICDSKIETATLISSWNNRVRTYHRKDTEIIRTPRTFKVPFSYENIGIGTDSHFGYLNYIESVISYPMIIKESYSSFGMGVHLAENRSDAIDLLCRYGNKECLIQEYIHSDGEKGAVDVRLQMVGDKCVAAMKRSNENDFKANITNGGLMSQYEPTEADLALAESVMKCLKLDFAGIDIIHDKDGNPVFCEANSNAHFKNLYDLTGINAAENMIDHMLETIKNKYHKEGRILR